MSKRKTKKTPIAYHGGKQAMLKHILPLIPSHTIYVEPFFGGGAVFWGKDVSDVEIINDYNAQVTNFYKELKHNFTQLQKAVFSTPFSRETYKQALVVYHAPYLFDPLQRAWAFWVCTIQGFSNQIGTWRCAQSEAREVNRLENKKAEFTEDLQHRLKGVQIENKDAVSLIERHDSEETFFYLDPPYVNSNQGHYAGYSQSDFERLLSALENIKGKFLLSSYPNEALISYGTHNNWIVDGKEMQLSASRVSNKKKKEMLTRNYI